MLNESHQKYRMINTIQDKKGVKGITDNTPKSAPSSLWKDKSIKKTKNIEEEKTSYKSFSVSFLISDLFEGNEYVEHFNTSPIIKYIDVPKSDKDRLSFFLPEEIFSFIVKKRSTNSSQEDYYAHFFQLKYQDNFVSNWLYDYYTEFGWKDFITKVQNHIKDKFVDIDLSENDELLYYLETVGNQIIVPKSKSPKSNAAFSELIEGGKKGNSENLALIIANFFISVFLGLRSMNCKVESYKMYLLSKFGMECIWRPDLISPPYERLFDSRSLFKNASYKSAISTVKMWLKEYEYTASNDAKALAYQILGLSLCSIVPQNDQESNDNKTEGIKYLKKSVDTGASEVSVFYSLYDYLKNTDFEEATEYLKTAFAQNYAKAVVEVALFYLDGNLIFEDITEKSLLEKINYIIANEQINDVTDVGKCLYLRGRLTRNKGDEAKAQKDFEAAARKGNDKAKQELIRKERAAEKGVFPSFSNQAKAKCCFANTLTGNNYQIISTFPNNEWSLFAPVKTTLNGIQSARNIDEFIKLQKIGEFEFCRPQIVFLFMSEDKEKNLNECLNLLDKLFNIVLDLSEKQKWELINKTHIYVGADYETASMLIDANVSQMGSDIYFKVHIKDEKRDTAHKLLCDAPLFLPALNGGKSEPFTKVILFGDSELNYTFIKESIASSYLGARHPIDITLLGENAEKLESRFNQECPGVFGCPSISCIRPKFISCSIKETDFPNCIYGKLHDIALTSEENKDNSIPATIAREFLSANYFIVDYADDLENIRFAMDLRTWLLRSKDSFDRTPFIAVKVSDKQNSYLTSHLTLTGQAAGNSYYNKYDLFPFGISAQTYHYRNLIKESVLDRIALQIHKFYYLDNDLDKNNEDELNKVLKKCKRSAENDYYSYSYNADSSLSTAIGLCYRFFAAECLLASKDDYLDLGTFRNQEILLKFTSQLNEKNKEDLSKLEQSRWNSYMIVHGWLPADKAQVEKYIEQSSGVAHKHILAKLHPFIAEWDNLDDSNLVDLLPVFKLKVNYSKKPQVTTRRSIEDTTRFFRTETKENEKTH